eukprot:CAMPEP_0184864910 /NCGR_PEP_ID=MMETSP0580-20130426/16297_1 /TAXON_ID=1118495 /ORGANISM="Dactyliosolen fragilissimus" /LENGTH=306 /DNA_ID=CAMNT_0027363859 /DNA_START=79 /DNA_END=1002 /DNA_ORIENTATION=-
MPSNLPYKQAANVERRTWDKEKYEALAQARARSRESNSKAQSTPIDSAKRDATTVSIGEKRVRPHSAEVEKQQTTSSLEKNSNVTSIYIEGEEDEKEEFIPAESGAEGPAFSKRAFLKARRSALDLEAKVGTSEIINPDAAAVTKTKTGDDDLSTTKITDGITKVTDGVGWHCKVCDCFLKDSMTYLDHINGRKHQRYLGYSMRVERSKKEDVVQTLSNLAKIKKEESSKAAAEISKCLKSDNGGDYNDFNEIVREKDEDVARRKAERATKRKERKKKLQEEQEHEEDDNPQNAQIAAMMGFSGFK